MNFEEYVMRKYFTLMVVVGMSAALVVNCGASIPRIPASGMVGGQRIETTVDSESARYYLEQYLPNRRTNAEFDSLFEQIHHQVAGSIPGRELLQQLSDSISVDFASLLLAERIVADEANRAIAAMYQRELEIVRSERDNAAAASGPPDRQFLILFVPGWDYVESGPVTGADFARPRQIISELGIENKLVEIEPTGAIETNAQIVVDEVKRPWHHERDIIIVSASSGGPATALAVGGILSAQQSGRIKAWINIGGILQGSPVSDHYLSWPRSWLARVVLFFKGWDYGSIRSMSVKQSRERFSRLHFPDHLLIINYIGIPLSGDITERASGTYPALRKYGPNDGFTLITDELAPNSVTITDVGRDHFFNEDPEIDLKTVALARTVFRALREKANETQKITERKGKTHETDNDCAMLPVVLHSSEQPQRSGGNYRVLEFQEPVRQRLNRDRRLPGILRQHRR